MRPRIGGFLLLAIAAPVFAALMLHTETTIPIPAPDETVALTGLVYKARFEARVVSVKLVVKSEAGADPVIGEWVFTGSNTDGQMHRLDMQIRLLDEKGKQVGWFGAKHPLSPGAREESFAVPMKVKSAVWEATKRVRIWANWIT